jgi:hypothetical protein
MDSASWRLRRLSDAEDQRLHGDSMSTSTTLSTKRRELGGALLRWQRKTRW